MRLILAGPPAAGKGTQAKKLCAKFDLVHVSTGDLIRAEVRAGTELGSAIKQLEPGSLVPDEIVIRMLLDRLAREDCHFLLDGFPRTVPQAEALERAGLQVDAVILIDVPDALLEERAIHRRTDPRTGTTYHLIYDPPPPEITELVHRDDDTIEVVATRIAKFHAETQPTIPFYEQRGLLRRVNGVGDPDAIHQRILDALR